MKRFSPLLFVCLWSCASTHLWTACSTAPTPTQQATVTAIAQSATFLGSSLYLSSHPQSRPQFLLAKDSLATLVAAGTFSSADLTTALQSLPIKFLQGDQGNIVIGETVIIWNNVGQPLATLDQYQVVASKLLPVAKAILAGLDQALLVNR